MNPNEFLELLKKAPNFGERLENLTTRFGAASTAQFLKQLTPNDLWQIASDSDGIQSVERKAGEKREKKAIKNIGRFVKLAGTLASAGAFLGSATALRGGAALTGEILGAQDEGPDMQRPQLPPPKDTGLLTKQGGAPTPPAPEPTQKPSLVREALKGIDIPNLEEFQTNKIRLLAKKLESLEAQGKGSDDKNVRKVMEQISRLGKMGVVDRETERFQEAYGPQNQDEKIAAQESDRLSPTSKASQVKDTPKLEKGDLVETKAGKNGRVVSVDYDKGIAKVKIDRKIHNKRIEDLTQKDWNELQSAVIENYAYSPDLQTALLKFRKGPWYGYQDVQEDSFERFAKGKGTARTTGEANGFKWWKGKNPSLGAAFWKELRDKNPYARLDESIDVDYFFTNFSEISPNLPWQIPQPKKKKKRKKR